MQEQSSTSDSPAPPESAPADHDPAQVFADQISADQAPPVQKPPVQKPPVQKSLESPSVRRGNSAPLTQTGRREDQALEELASEPATTRRQQASDSDTTDSDVTDGDATDGVVRASAAPSSSTDKPPKRPAANKRSSAESGQASASQALPASRAAGADEVAVVGDPSKTADRIWRGRDLGACVLSGLIHALLLLLLAFLVIPMVAGRSAIVLLSTALDEDGGELQLLEAMQESALPEEAIEIEATEFTPEETKVPEIDFPIPEETAISPPELSPVANPVASGAGPQASSVESAVDGITGAILGELEKGDVLVVWLLDASHSLVDDRQRVADRLTPFFEKIRDSREENSEAHELLNSVVSFGATTRERVPPTKFGPRIVKAVKNMPIDESGKENVFASIAQCATTHRKKWRDKSLMIVVWTDETGDDAKRLEQTIQVCKQMKAKVAIVGPSSVLGAETGLHSYTDAKTKKRYLLPVNRGPDAAQPERLELGYWFNPRLPSHMVRGGSLPSWYGGPDMKGVASGFSPYALTRLAAQTGGMYTIFDRAEDRGPFRFETLKAYAPDYGSASAYDDMIRSYPLRQAVMQAVEATQGKRLSAPETVLFVKRSKSDPTVFQRPYMTPGQFAAQLKTRKHAMQRVADRVSSTIEDALKHLSKNGDVASPLDELYSQESSPRWKAWYDLTRGRLLAISVRLEEYRLALDAATAPGFLREPTNHLVLGAQQNLRSSQEFQRRAEEAEQLLSRCLNSNADTPWAYLAQREMANALGVRVQQVTLRLVRTRGPARRSSSPSLPKF